MTEHPKHTTRTLAPATRAYAAPAILGALSIVALILGRQADADALVVGMFVLGVVLMVMAVMLAVDIAGTRRRDARPLPPEAVERLRDR